MHDVRTLGMNAWQWMYMCNFLDFKWNRQYGVFRYAFQWCHMVDLHVLLGQFTSATVSKWYIPLACVCSSSTFHLHQLWSRCVCVYVCVCARVRAQVRVCARPMIGEVAASIAIAIPGNDLASIGKNASRVNRSDCIACSSPFRTDRSLILAIGRVRVGEWEAEGILDAHAALDAVSVKLLSWTRTHAVSTKMSFFGKAAIDIFVDTACVICTRVVLLALEVDGRLRLSPVCESSPL